LSLSTARADAGLASNVEGSMSRLYSGLENR